MREQSCVHRTGIGKTRSMIEMLNDSYTWQVAKVVIVPKLNAVTKFLCEIMPWPKKALDAFRQKWEALCQQKHKEGEALSLAVPESL